MSSRRSAARRCGAGSRQTRSVPGAIAVGCSRTIPTLWRSRPILDLYAGLWDGTPLWPDDCVLSADEKTSIQARRRRHAPVPCGSDRVAKIEHEYERMGAWAYLAAWDVQRAILFGRCEPANGIAAFDRLVAQVMAQEPYRSARRVFWIVENGSGSSRAEGSRAPPQRQWPNIVPVFTPIHASWLNQIEIYFSVVQRKVLTPADFADLAALEATLGFQRRCEAAARPFERTFTRQIRSRC
ncbi:MAG TPA: transposase [Vicinamibacterales bacterium]|nr:transposase [Vicinamibacterales bacterium]